MGMLLFLVRWGPAFVIIIAISSLVTGEGGRVPLWFALTMGAFFNLIWMCYDVVFKPIFGDGERTQETGDDSTTGVGDRKRGFYDEERPLLDS